MVIIPYSHKGFPYCLCILGLHFHLVWFLQRERVPNSFSIALVSLSTSVPGFFSLLSSYRGSAMCLSLSLLIVCLWPPVGPQKLHTVWLSSAGSLAGCAFLWNTHKHTLLSFDITLADSVTTHYGGNTLVI